MPNALSQEFPFLEGQPAESNEALSSTSAITSVGITMLRMLETLLPAAAEEVERESRAIAEHFMTLVNYIESTGKPPVQVSEAISGLIVGMQFQDRNTQIMDNVAGMLERYRAMLEEVSINIEAMREGAIAPGHTITQAVDDILSSIRLSDIRTRYLDALSKTKHQSPSQGFETQDQVYVPDIELF